MKKSIFLVLTMLCFSALTLEAKSVEKHNSIIFQKSEAMALTYITEPQFIAMMSEQDLSDLTDNLTGTDRTSLLEEVNREAVSDIDGYLFGRYTLPITGTDDKLTTMTKDLMKYRLYKRRDELNMPENVIKIYSGIIKDLEKIASGTINLKIERATSGGENDTSQGRIKTENRPKTNRYNLS